MRLELIPVPGADNSATWLLGAVLNPVHEVPHGPLSAACTVGLQRPLHLGSLVAIHFQHSLPHSAHPKSAAVVTGGREEEVKAVHITHLGRQTLNLMTAVKLVKREQPFVGLQD